MKTMSSTKEQDFDIKLKAFHRRSSRHVLVLETNMSHKDKCKVFHYADLIRKAGNELVAIMKNNLEQLCKLKKYKKLKSLYAKSYKAKDHAKCKQIASQLNELYESYNLTKRYCEKAMIPLGKKYQIGSVFALAKAEDVWMGVEKCLFSNGRTLRFSKYNELPVIRAKQNFSGIVLKEENDKLQFKFNGSTFGVAIKDGFEKDEVNSILEFMYEKDRIEKEAIETLEKSNTCISTYRACFASLVCKTIRNKLRVYVHITLEGNAKPKYDKLGNLKHTLGTGKVGCDIGTQSIAYTTDTKLALKNLAQRGSSIIENEKKERAILRALERSRRATNPNNYNEDGTLKKGRKTWKYSARYQKLKAKYTELSRKNAVNRHLAINQEVNYLRSLGDVFITETKNAKALQRRAKETTVNANGKINRKKRFGRSIKNRCPGYFQAQVKRKFTQTCGTYIEVPQEYRASQYDHTVDEYIKKKLSERMFKLTDGSRVQRDLYSSFLLYNIDLKARTIDRAKCIESFNDFLVKQQDLITYIKVNKIKVANSGIKL